MKVVGWLPGGLGHVNILSSVIFAGMSPDGLLPETIELFREDFWRHPLTRITGKPDEQFKKLAVSARRFVPVSTP